MTKRRSSWDRRSTASGFAAAFLALSGALVATGCSKQDEIQPEGAQGGSGNAGGTSAASGGNGAAAGTGAADASNIPPGDLGCPASLAGPPLTRIQTADDVVYCMDQREVTWGEYQAFLAAKGADTSGQPGECEWNTKLEPQYQAWDDDSELEPGECPSGSEHKSDDQAVNCVDFCDALAYCEWAGKRLCGRVGGSSKWGRVDVGATAADVAGKQALSDLAGTTAMEFGHACTQGGKTTYPYGNAYEPARCIDWEWIQTKGTSALAVTDLSNRSCHGTQAPFTQIYDLSGSVVEWQNLCWDATSPSCLHIGGSWSEYDKDRQACAADVGFGSAKTATPAKGFRCCADAVPLPASKQ